MSIGEPIKCNNVASAEILAFFKRFNMWRQVELCYVKKTNNGC